MVAKKKKAVKKHTKKKSAKKTSHKVNKKKTVKKAQVKKPVTVKHKPVKKKVVHNKNQEKVKYVVAVLVILIVLATLALYSLDLLNKKDIVATVNGEPIYLLDLEKQYNQIPLEYQDLTSKQAILNQLIDEELLIQEAKKRGIKATKKEVDDIIQEAIQSTGLTQELFEKELEKNNLTMDEMRNYYEKQIIIYQKLPLDEFDSGIQITQGDVKSFYESNKNLFIDPTGNQLTLQEAEETIELYLVGEEQKQLFSELVKELRAKADIKILELDKISGKAVSMGCTFEDVVFYHAEWASLSQQMKPIVEQFNVQLIEESANSLLKECYPANMELGIPQLICTKDGSSLVGLKTTEEVSEFISEC